MGMCLTTEFGKNLGDGLRTVSRHEHHEDQLYGLCLLHINSDLVFPGLPIPEKIRNKVLSLGEPHVVRRKHGLRLLVALLLRNERKNLQRKVRRFIKSVQIFRFKVDTDRVRQVAERVDDIHAVHQISAQTG